MRINQLVLLCGFSRSGTTWLSKILDSMPSTFLCSEPDKRINKQLKFGKVPHCIREDNEEYISIYRDCLSEVATKIDCNLRSFPFFKKDYLALPYSIYVVISYIAQFSNYMANRYGLGNISLPAFLYKGKISVDFIWKSVNQSSNLPFIQIAFPRIKIIYLLRNPYSSIASLLKNSTMALDGQDDRRIWERKDSFYFRNREVDLKKISLSEEIEKKALLWRIECENALMAGLNKKNFLPVLYEDLISNVDNQTDRVCNFLGLRKSQETKNFLEQSTGRQKPPIINRAFSSGYFGVYRKPGVNLNKWKKTISKKEYKLIRGVIGTSPLLQNWSEDMLRYD